MIDQTEFRPYAKNQREVYPEAIRELLAGVPSVRLPGLPIFDEFTGGFRPHEFGIVCGSTGAGKTTLLANFSAHLIQQGIKHFVMSVETGHTDYMRRIVSALAGIDLNTGDKVSSHIIERIHNEHRKALESGTVEFSLYENRIPVEQLIQDIEYMVLKKGCQLVFMDNINFFVEVTTAQEAVIAMDRTIHELIIACKRLPVHMIMVMHPKKTENGTFVRSEFDIKGSSSSVQEAQNVLLWNRPTKESIDSGERTPFHRELTIAKMRRRGMHVGKTIVFESRGTRYSEVGVV